jgi:lysophospholipase L1-like esterase
MLAAGKGGFMTFARALACVLGVVLFPALAAGAASGPVYQAPQAYYLALGDSIAYGFQPAKAQARLPPSKFNTGYVDVFAARMRTLASGLQVVNYSCPGESTKTFIAGGCPGRGDVRGLHDTYRGAQLTAALAFLRAHSGEVGPITLTLWGNDLFEDFAPTCKGDLACIKSHARAGLARLSTRLTTIVNRLRTAAPTAEIILTGAWNFDVEQYAQADPLFRSIDATIARVAALGRARVAKMYPVFDPAGSLAVKKARICKLTFICTKGDPHPTDAGYRAMAAAFWSASGYR